MAIRVKKLARELRCAPSQVIALLTELGYPRYRTGMDMVGDAAAEKVRGAVRRGKLPADPAASDAEPEPVSPIPPPGRPRTPPPAADDFMAHVVQGMAPAQPLDMPLDRLVGSSGGLAERQRALDEAVSATRAEELRLQERQRRLSERESGLQARAAELEAERDALAAERTQLLDELAQARRELEIRTEALDAREAGGIPLARLLDERGLHGADEHDRALAALARARLLGSVAERVRLIDPGPIVRLLEERLVLTGGPVPDLAGVATVTVPAERAEVPGGEVLARTRDLIGGELLLSGLRTVRLVGAQVAALRLLREGVDPRIELQVVRATRRDAAAARSDVSDIDALVLWGVEETEEARAVYDGSGIVIARVPLGSLSDLPAGLRAALAVD